MIISTMSLDEATVIRAAGYIVTVHKKACSPRALFEFQDTPATRELLEQYARKEILNIPARTLMIVRSQLYKDARVARGGL